MHAREKAVCPPAGPTPLWEQQARLWRLLKPPFKPSGEDLAWARERIDRLGDASSPVLILGVTPELVSLRRTPEGLTVATDISMPMIGQVWPPFRRRERGHAAVRADWTALPFLDRSCDLVLGDHSLASCRREQAIRILRGVRRVLRPSGTFLFRNFVRPGSPERPERVREDLMARRIGSFPLFKLRLLMSLTRLDGEVHVTDAWEFFTSRCPEPVSLARHLDWPLEEVRTMEAYRGQPAVYWFPTLSELRELLNEDFEELDSHFPGYEMGERCPTFACRTRG